MLYICDMSELKKLELQLEHNHNERFKLTEEIYKLETQEQLPTLKEKYENKYWKYENTYGGDESWWLYAHCKEAVATDNALYNTFQLAPHENTFKVNE